MASKAPTVMYDSVDVATIPRNAQAVAGYVDGKYRTFSEVLKHFFPHAHCISISVFGNYAQCLDIEPGNVAPSAAGPWARDMLERGVWKPILYASLSEMEAVLASLHAHRIRRDQVRLWVAHYTYHPHIPAGYDACQWTDRADGRNLDQSLVAPSFWRQAVAPPKKDVRPKNRKIHPKVAGSVSGTAVTSGVLSVLHAAGVHVTPVELTILVSLGTLIAGYFTPARR